MIIGTGNASGMGDVLLLTSICKHIPGCTVELHPGTERFSIFFDGLCEKVVIKDKPLDLSNIGNDHYTLSKMRSVGLNNKCYLPYIKISEEQRQKGRNLISEYENPIVFKPNCAAHWNHLKEFSKDIWNPILDELSKTHTILQFGLESNFTDYDQAIKIKNCSIEDMICYYSAIKKYIGVDTGDLHLMLACGGTIDVYCPPTCVDYVHSRWHYKLPQASYYEVHDDLKKVYKIQ